MVGASVAPYLITRVSRFSLEGAFRAVGPPNNGAFHINANDAANPTRLERLFSPVIAVPVTAEYVTIDMDVAYNTEDDPSYNVLCYDGFLLRIADHSGGTRLLPPYYWRTLTRNFPPALSRITRSTCRVIIALPTYRIFPRGGGYSNGFKHVRAKLPGTSLASVASGTSLAGSSIQLRFEYTQDSGGTAFNLRPQNLNDPTLATSGVVLDNLVVAAVTSRSVELAKLTLTPISGQTGKYNGVISSLTPSAKMASPEGVIMEACGRAPA